MQGPTQWPHFKLTLPDLLRMPLLGGESDRYYGGLRGALSCSMIDLSADVEISRTWSPLYA